MYLLLYEVVERFVELREPLRDEHLALVRDAHARGELVMAGSHGEPVDGAVLVFRAADPSVAESFAKSDPYVKRGLVTRWRVRKWHEVLTT